MQRTNIIQLKPSRKQKAILKELCLLSSCVYNSTNYIIRQQFFNNEKISGFFELREKLQTTEDYQLLGRSYALPRIQVYAETNTARFKLIKSKKQSRVGLPKYLKNRKTNTTLPSYLAMDNCQYCLTKTKATIPLSRQMRKKYSIKTFRIPYNGILRWQGRQQRGQIHFKDGNFYIYQTVEIQEPQKKQSQASAGVDFGIKKLIAIRTSTGQDKIIGSKRHFRQWLFWTNLIAKEQENLAKINRKSSKNLQRLFSKREKWQNNLYNNLTAKMFKFLNRNNISRLAIGNITNIREDKDWGSKGNKMLHNYWAFDKLLHKAENKAEEYGIETDNPTEEYTSRMCPICGDDSKTNCKDRIFLCSFCGYIDHRDLVGAGNIHTKSMYGSTESIHWQEILPFGEGQNA
jgi:putative transposase